MKKVLKINYSDNIKSFNVLLDNNVLWNYSFLLKNNNKSSLSFINYNYLLFLKKLRRFGLVKGFYF